MANEKLAVTGHVIHVGETQVITERFQKREMIIEIRDNPSYPQTIQFEAHQDRCDLLENIGFGDEVKVHFNLTGKTVEIRGEHRNFNTLVAWRFEKMGATAAAAKPNSPGVQRDPGAYVPLTPEEQKQYDAAPKNRDGSLKTVENDDDDLPF